jgi:hypothetical protein
MEMEEDSEGKPPNSLMEIEPSQRHSSPTFEFILKSTETNSMSKTYTQEYYWLFHS